MHLLLTKPFCIMCICKYNWGSFINHVDIFDSPPPSWSLLLKKAYVIKWTNWANPLPFSCPRGLCMSHYYIIPPSEYMQQYNTKLFLRKNDSLYFLKLTIF